MTHSSLTHTNIANESFAFPEFCAPPASIST